jgi:hypothetical protein
MEKLNPLTELSDDFEPIPISDRESLKTIEDITNRRV